MEVIQGGLDGGHHKGGERAVWPWMAASTSSIMGLGKRMDFTLVGGILGIRKAITSPFCNTFGKTIVLQNPQFYCKINRLHFVVYYMGDDVMQENPAKVPEERQADYREMYLVMARAMEKCVRELIEASGTARNCTCGPRRSKPLCRGSSAAPGAR